MIDPSDTAFPEWDMHDLHCAMIGNMIANKSLFKDLPIATSKEIDDLAENMALMMLHAGDVLLRLGRDPADEMENYLSRTKND